MNKKGATALSVLLLVIMTLVLTGFALFTFLISEKVETMISDVRVVEDVYVKEEQINFYLDKGIFVPQEEEEYVPFSIPESSENIYLQNAVDLVYGARIVGNKVEIHKRILNKEDVDKIVEDLLSFQGDKKTEFKRGIESVKSKIEVTYTFEPKLKPKV